MGGGLTAPALTAKDMDDVKTAAMLEATYSPCPFPKNKEDMYMARQLLRAAGGRGLLIAKIERAEAITALDEIIDSSDGIMVARGDLAVEVGNAAVPGLQKRMLKIARERNKLTITATQMMESMIHAPVPTRAEVSDVANAVLDGTDAVMLSAGDRSRQVSRRGRREHGADLRGGGEVRSRGARPRLPQSHVHAGGPVDRDGRALHSVPPQGEGDRLADRFRIDGAVDVASQPRMPHLRADPEDRVAAQDGALPRVQTLFLEQSTDRDAVLLAAEALLVSKGEVRDGDLVVLTIGEPMGKPGGTNTMKIVRVGEHRK
jgi:pyruvate kinase